MIAWQWLDVHGLVEAGITVHGGGGELMIKASRV